MNNPIFTLLQMSGELGAVFFVECTALYFVIKWGNVRRLPGIRWFIFAIGSNVYTSLCQLPWIFAYAHFTSGTMTAFADVNPFWSLSASLIDLSAHIAWVVGTAKLWHYSRSVRNTATSPVTGRAPA